MLVFLSTSNRDSLPHGLACSVRGPHVCCVRCAGRARGAREGRQAGAAGLRGCAGGAGPGRDRGPDHAPGQVRRRRHPRAHPSLESPPETLLARCERCHVRGRHSVPSGPGHMFLLVSAGKAPLGTGVLFPAKDRFLMGLCVHARLCVMPASRPRCCSSRARCCMGGCTRVAMAVTPLGLRTQALLCFLY